MSKKNRKAKFHPPQLRTEELLVKEAWRDFVRESVRKLVPSVTQALLCEKTNFIFDTFAGQVSRVMTSLPTGFRKYSATELYMQMKMYGNIEWAVRYVWNIYCLSPVSEDRIPLYPLTECVLEYLWWLAQQLVDDPKGVTSRQVHFKLKDLHRGMRMNKNPKDV